MGHIKQVLKWFAVYVALNLILAASTFVSYRLVEEITVNSVFEQLTTVLESRLTALGTSYRVPSDRNSYSLNQLMHHDESALGKTGETYIVERKGPLCRIASRSRFEGYNDDNGVFHCTGHWQAIFKQGTSTKGQWKDYRKPPADVYGVGQRISRQSKTGAKTYAIVVERDVNEVRLGIAKLTRVSLIVMMGFMVGTGFACVAGFYLQRKQRRSAIENEATLNNVTSGIIRVNAEREIVSISPYMLGMFGYESESELVGHCADMLFPDEHLGADISSFNRLYSGEGTEEDRKITLEGKRKDGSQFPLKVTRQLVEFPEGMQVLKVLDDLSDEYAQRERIERKNEALRQFARVARHDLCNAVSPAAMAIEYQMEAGYDEDAMKMANRELQGAMRMFQDLSVWSKSIEADSYEIEKEDIDLNELIQSVLIEGVLIEIEGDLGKLQCNAGMMMAAIRNILENSVKYCPTQPDISIIREDNAMYIRDNAGGYACIAGKYDPDYADRLSKPGERGHNDVEGSGLGIANCTSLLQAHGFKLSWDVECGVGTTWNLHF